MGVGQVVGALDSCHSFANSSHGKLSSHCGKEFVELIASIVRSQIIKLVVLRNSL